MKGQFSLWSDLRTHLTGIHLCEALKLGYPALYEQAYEWQGEKPGKSWVRFFDWTEVEVEPTLPSDETLKKFLYSLGQMDHGSVITVLQVEFTRLGYNVDKWWEKV